MGHAAYMRGSALISRQMCAVRGCHGCMYCSEYMPTPRAEDWGSKTRAKALKKARGLLRYLTSRGQAPSETDLADMVQYDTKIGRTTAEAAAAEALSARKETP